MLSSLRNAPVSHSTANQTLNEVDCLFACLWQPETWPGCLRNLEVKGYEVWPRRDVLCSGGFLDEPASPRYLRCSWRNLRAACRDARPERKDQTSSSDAATVFLSVLRSKDYCRSTWKSSSRRSSFLVILFGFCQLLVHHRFRCFLSLSRAIVAN